MQHNQCPLNAPSLGRLSSISLFPMPAQQKKKKVHVTRGRVLPSILSHAWFTRTWVFLNIPFFIPGLKMHPSCTRTTNKREITRLTPDPQPSNSRSDERGGSVGAEAKDQLSQSEADKGKKKKAALLDMATVQQ